MQNAPATGGVPSGGGTQGSGLTQGQPQVNSTQVMAPQVAGAAGGGAGGAGGRVSGGRFDFDDGGTYCGGWEDGKAHGHGVCTGPKGQGAYSGSWHYGFEVSGVYTWPSGSTFEGQWQNGKRHGLGLESRGRWLYRGEWTQGFKGRYGVRQSATSNARYEGTWANGLQDGYGSETYADGGTYQGQWLRGMRHGYGVRASAPFGLASHYRPSKTQLRASLTSLRSAEGGGGGGVGGGGGGAAEAGAAPSDLRDRRVDDARGGFVLKARSDDAPTARRRSLVEKSTNLKKSLFSGLKIRRQRSTGDLEKRGTSASIRSAGSSASWVSTESSQSAMTSASVHTDSNASFVVEDEQMDASVTETYMGEWKNDRRSGFGISERSDGLRYEGEWFNNKKYGYGATTFKDGSKEEGKYKNNVLITSQKKKHLFLIRSAKFRERIDSAVIAAQRASKIALQKADIAISRTATARGKAELADVAASHAHEDSEIARRTAKMFAPDFQQPGLDRIRPKYRFHTDTATQQQQTASPTSQASTGSPMQQATTSMPTSPVASQQQYSATARNAMDVDAAVPNKNTPTSPYQQVQQQYQQQQQQHQQQYQQQQQHQQQQQYQQQQQQYQQQYQQQLSNQQMMTGGQQQAQSGQQSPYMNQQQPSQAVATNTPQQQASVSQSQSLQRSTQQQNYQNADASNSGGVGASTTEEGAASAEGSGAQDRGAAAQRSSSNLTRGGRARPDAGEPPGYSFQQAMSDHFDHYKRPPSRDSSVDRYTRAASRLASRTPSVDNPGAVAAAAAAALAGGVGGVGLGVQPNRMVRNTTPTPGETAGMGQRRTLLGAAAEGAKAGAAAGNGAVLMGVAAATSPLLFGAAGAAPSSGGAGGPAPLPPGYPPFEEVLLRKRGLGQDILPSLAQPKRTESLYIGQPVLSRPPPVKASVLASAGPLPPAGAMSRKKSLPDVQALPKATEPMSREEVSALGSMRREEIRRMAEDAERLRANPLLYLVSPGVKDWFSRQKLVMLVLFINISLAIMFFKLLT